MPKTNETNVPREPTQDSDRGPEGQRTTCKDELKKSDTEEDLRDIEETLESWFMEAGTMGEDGWTWWWPKVQDRYKEAIGANVDKEKHTTPGAGDPREGGGNPSVAGEARKPGHESTIEAPATTRTATTWTMETHSYPGDWDNLFCGVLKRLEEIVPTATWRHGTERECTAAEACARITIRMMTEVSQGEEASDGQEEAPTPTDLAELTERMRAWAGRVAQADRRFDAQGNN